MNVSYDIIFGRIVKANLINEKQNKTSIFVFDIVLRYCLQGSILKETENKSNVNKRKLCK